ncbi:MAG TPA: hypothetical protein VK928_04945, partial [Longimicrobiales bacterium]|nr:hypothetical protein [Longimicrobiales bacterium]
MRSNRRSLPVFLLPLLVAACATTTRLPLTDVPSGTYVLVEPASDVYNAASINQNAFSMRMGDATHTGQHWVDSQGRIHMMDDAGPCAGMESVWTYTYANNRVTLNRVS